MNDTDKELLAQAAKAAGIEIEFRRWSGIARTGLFSWHGDWTSGERAFIGVVEWNPLTDDGDALRLAVKLRLDVSVGDDDVVAEVNRDTLEAMELHGADVYAATRRAIVRAAAEIAKAMP